MSFKLTPGKTVPGSYPNLQNGSYFLGFVGGVFGIYYLQGGTWGGVTINNLIWPSAAQTFSTNNPYSTSGVTIAMQTNNNSVLTDVGGVTIWCSDTYNSSTAGTLTLGSDGSLKIISSSGAIQVIYPGPGSCFGGDGEVELENGSTKKVSELKKGDAVRTGEKKSCSC